MLLEDKTLIENFLNGDNDAFGELVEKYQNMVHYLAFSILNNFHDAEDVVQETFIRAYLHLHQLSNVAKFCGWLHKIARNTSYNWLKRESKRVSPLSDLSLGDVNQMSLQRHRDKELSTELQDALDSLSEKQRPPLLLSLAGYSYQEISGFISVSESTIRGRIARAKQSLRKEILGELHHEVNAHKLDKQFAQGIMAMIRQLPRIPTQPKSKPITSRIIPFAIIGLLAIIAIVLKMFYFAPGRENAQVVQSGLTHERTNREWVNHGWTRTLISEWTSDGSRVVYNPRDGYIYTTGFFASTVDFDPSDGMENLSSSGWRDWYVWKLNSSGLYGNDGWFLTDGSTTGNDIIDDIAFDWNNNLYVVGTMGVPIVVSRTGAYIGNSNALIAKYNQDREVQWSYVFSSGNSLATSLAVSSDNKSIFVTGRFRNSMDFDPTYDTDIHTAIGSWDVFIIELGVDGTYLWSKQIGGTDEELGRKIAIDINDNIYISGIFKGTVDFDPGPGVDYRTSNGSNDVFVMKLNSDGSYAWAKTFGGTGNDILGYSEANGMLVTEDMIYLVGWFYNEVDFDPGVGVDIRISNGDTDAYMLSLNLNGNYNWVKTFGGIEGISCEGITRWNNEIYITGGFMGTVDFDPGPGVDEHSRRVDAGTPAESTNMFISKYDSNNNYLWTETVGSSRSWIGGHSIAIDDYGDIYISGWFNYTVDFDLGLDADFRTASSRDLSMFITKFTPH